MFLDLVRKRKSVRSYIDRAIPDDLLYEIIEAARLAPSAKNVQEWKFILIRDPATKEALVNVAKGQQFVGESAVVIAGVATQTGYIMTNGIPACNVDLAIAMEHIALAAAEHNIGTCWIGAFYQDKAKELLHVPDDCIVISFMTLGYTTEDFNQSIKQRKKIEEIICQERYT